MTGKAITTRIELLIELLAGGSKKTFADQLEIVPPMVDKWTNRGSQPSAETLARFKTKLGVNINWLLTGEGPMYIDKSQSPANAPELSLKSLKIGRLYEDADTELKQIVDRVLSINPKPPASGGKKK